MLPPYKKPPPRNKLAAAHIKFEYPGGTKVAGRPFIAVEILGCILLLAHLLTVAVLVSCSWEGSKSVFPEQDLPLFTIIETSIEKGEAEVARDAEFFIRFSDRPDPADLDGANLNLSGGGFPVALRRTSDFVSCGITMTPFEPLEPGLSHVLSISSNLVSIHGAPLDEELDIHFTTTLTDPDPEPVPEPKITDEEIQAEVFDIHCKCCHDPESGRFNHVLALDASKAVNARSRQRPEMKLVEPGSHAHSYLLHKILGFPTTAGEPMPPKDEECGDPWPSQRSCPVTDPALKLLGDWILRHPGN